MRDEYQILIPFLALAAIAVYFLPSTRARIRNIPHRRFLLTSFVLLTVGWTSKFPGGYLYPDFFNVLTHICFCASTLVFMGWAWLIQPGKGPP